MGDGLKQLRSCLRYGVGGRERVVRVHEVLLVVDCEQRLELGEALRAPGWHARVVAVETAMHATGYADAALMIVPHQNGRRKGARRSRRGLVLRTDRMKVPLPQCVRPRFALGTSNFSEGSPELSQRRV